MDARKHGRGSIGMHARTAALAAMGLLATTSAPAARGQEQQRGGLFNRAQATKSAGEVKQGGAPAEGVKLDQGSGPGKLTMFAVPVNPSDPIAVVNKEVITRQRLAEETLVCKGREVLETLINRVLIDQALRARKMEVTAADVDNEIERIAREVHGIGRVAWLTSLEKERGISPAQYAREIIYPGLALQRLAEERVKVTPADEVMAFESRYGEKLKCRVILLDKLETAQEIWDALRKDPLSFEKQAQEHSIDNGSRSLGGLMTEPITRHALPTPVSDAAFKMLVDGDPEDKDPAHKPKNGDFTGPIPITDASWAIFQRVELLPPARVDRTNPILRKQVRDMIYQVKLQQERVRMVGELVKAAAIENHITGVTKSPGMQPDPEATGANVDPLKPKDPNEPAALVNGEAIARARLIDECIARKGPEVLDSLIDRTIINQALREKKLAVTTEEVENEIERIARQVGNVNRAKWLKMLEQKQGISPAQYARDLIYRPLALRKLAREMVTVTPDDEKLAFEAQYGEKLKCRVILVDKLKTAQEVWKEIDKNPGGFERIAQERSMDQSSASIGGLMAEPVTRHAIPTEVSDKIFRQLVDGDPADLNREHKPKDHDFTGPIQVADNVWAIFRREELMPAPKADPKDPAVRGQLRAMMFEVRLKEKINDLHEGLIKASAIDNKLTGVVKLANEELDPDYRYDGKVKLMGHEQEESKTAGRGRPVVERDPHVPTVPPSELAPELAGDAAKLLRKPAAQPAAPSSLGVGGAGTAVPATPAAKSPEN